MHFAWLLFTAIWIGRGTTLREGDQTRIVCLVGMLEDGAVILTLFAYVNYLGQPST